MSWGHTEKNCKFKMGFNGVVTYYSVLLWNYKHLLGQCGCLILIVKVIDATYIGSIEEFKILSASGHIPGNLPPWGGSTPETGFADFSKCFFFYLNNVVCPVLDLEGTYWDIKFGTFLFMGYCAPWSQSGILTHCGLSYIVLNNRAWLL